MINDISLHFSPFPASERGGMLQCSRHFYGVQLALALFGNGQESKEKKNGS